MSATNNEETMRIEEARVGKAPWKKWILDLSEGHWGTVQGNHKPLRSLSALTGERLWRKKGATFCEVVPP